MAMPSENYTFTGLLEYRNQQAPVLWLRVDGGFALVAALENATDPSLQLVNLPGATVVPMPDKYAKQPALISVMGLAFGLEHQARHISTRSALQQPARGDLSDMARNQHGVPIHLRCHSLMNREAQVMGESDTPWRLGVCCFCSYQEHSKAYGVSRHKACLASS